MKRPPHIFIFFSLLILMTCASCAEKQHRPLNLNESPPEKKPALQQAKKETIRIAAVGDIMLGTSFPSEDYLPENDGKNLLKSVSPFLKDSDIAFGNLEGSLSDSGECIKKCSDPEKCYAFRMPQKFAATLKNAGFSLLSIGNNHINDFGDEGRNNTIKTLERHGIFFAGVDSHPSTFFSINGIRAGFCAFSPNNGVPDLRNISEACETVRRLSEKAEIVIVSFHGGAEGAEHRHVTGKDEFFYGENRGNICEFAHRVIDAGADLVLGHGPHITRAVELYKGRFIAYSLGNFCTYARFNLRGVNGIAPLLQIEIDKTGAFTKGKIIPLWQEYKKGPLPDTDRRAILEIKELTESDFPGTGISVADDGSISLIFGGKIVP